MIRSFGDALTEEVFHGELSRRVKRLERGLIKTTLRKLDMLNAAHDLIDLRVPPGNRLEVLRGGLAGFHSIRVNKQWRLIFKWDAGGVDQVQLVDYH